MCVVGIILFFLGFLISMWVFDDQQEYIDQRALESLHRENDQSDFLRDMNTWPVIQMSKYDLSYLDHYELFKRLWNEDKPGG